MPKSFDRQRRLAARAAPPPSEATKAALAAAETARRLATSDARLAASERFARHSAAVADLRERTRDGEVADLEHDDTMAARMADADAAYSAHTEREAAAARRHAAAIEVAALVASTEWEAGTPSEQAVELVGKVLTGEVTADDAVRTLREADPGAAYERGAGSRLDAEHEAGMRAWESADVEAMPVTWQAEAGASVRDDGSGPPELSPGTDYVRALCAALGEPYETADAHGVRTPTWAELLALTAARTAAWRAYLERLEQVDPAWVERRRHPPRSTDAYWSAHLADTQAEDEFMINLLATPGNVSEDAIDAAHTQALHEHAAREAWIADTHVDSE